MLEECGWNVKCMLPLTSIACISTRGTSREAECGEAREDAKGGDSSMNVEDGSSVVADTVFHLHRNLGPGLP